MSTRTRALGHRSDRHLAPDAARIVSLDARVAMQERVVVLLELVVLG